MFLVTAEMRGLMNGMLCACVHKKGAHACKRRTRTRAHWLPLLTVFPQMARFKSSSAYWDLHLVSFGSLCFFKTSRDLAVTLTNRLHWHFRNILNLYHMLYMAVCACACVCVCFIWVFAYVHRDRNINTEMTPMIQCWECIRPNAQFTDILALVLTVFIFIFLFCLQSLAP